MMKKWMLLIGLLLPTMVSAAGGGNHHLDKAEIDLSDKASLQSGAQLFMNYCFGCHSTQYQRYNRVARDLGISDDQMAKNLVFTDAKVGELMQNSMQERDGARWFGAAPPDLTLVARVRGSDWLYTYLRTFYADPSRPFGVNNLLFPSVGMPHVLEELQGIPTKVTETQMLDGEEQQVTVGIETDGSGELSEEEYDVAVRDLVNFLTYSAEPIALERESIGKWVLGFIVILFVLTYLLKKEFWRDVH